MYFEQPQLAQWDSAKNNWRLDTFTDTQYNEGTPPLNGFQILREITLPVIEKGLTTCM